MGVSWVQSKRCTKGEVFPLLKKRGRVLRQEVHKQGDLSFL